MKKFDVVAESNQTIFEDVLIASGLDNYINVVVLSNSKLRTSPDGLCCKVVIINQVAQSAADAMQTKKQAHAAIIVNEDLFDRLDEKTQKFVAENIVAQISFDDENDRVLNSKPDFQFGTGMIRKHGFEYLESILLAIQSVQQSMDEEAQEKKEAKTKKRKSTL